MKLKYKISLTLVLALVIGGMFFHYEKKASDLAASSAAVSGKVEKLERLEKELDYELLQASFFLYHNYDRLSNIQKELSQELSEMSAKDLPPAVADILGKYDAGLTKKQKYIELFQTANSIIKNSSIYIPALEVKYLETFGEGDIEYFRLLSEITSVIFLAKNSLDSELVKALKKPALRLEKYELKERNKREFNKLFLSHVKVFTDYFPYYSASLLGLRDINSLKTLQKLKTALFEEREKSLSFVKPLARLLFLFFIASIGLGLGFIVKAEKQRMKSFEAEKRHLEEKVWLLKDLHDGIGGSTANISLLADMAKNAPSLEEIKKSLTVISDLSREGLSDIRSFLQSLDEEKTDWQSLIADMRHFGSRLVEAHGISFGMTDNIKDIKGPPGSLLRLNLFRIYREALNNIVKHSGAKSVVAALSVNKEGVVFSVRDDGAGLTRGEGKGRGVSSMKARTEKMGGVFTIGSDKGTFINCEIPLPLKPPPGGRA